MCLLFCHHLAKHHMHICMTAFDCKSGMKYKMNDDVSDRLNNMVKRKEPNKKKKKKTKNKAKFQKCTLIGCKHRIEHWTADTIKKRSKYTKKKENKFKEKTQNPTNSDE